MDVSLYEPMFDVAKTYGKARVLPVTSFAAACDTCAAGATRV
jgi:hypothetical protein